MIIIYSTGCGVVSCTFEKNKIKKYKKAIIKISVSSKVELSTLEETEKYCRCSTTVGHWPVKRKVVGSKPAYPKN